MALSVFQTFNGHYGISTGGWGSNLLREGTITSTIPAGATVVAAYLYTHYAGVGVPGLSAASSAAGVTLNGESLSFTSCGEHPTGNHLQAFRADVTDIVADVVDGGAGGAYDFTVNEPFDALMAVSYGAYFNNHLTGEALVIIYDLASLVVGTVVIVDGWAGFGTHDFVDFNYPAPLDPEAADFFAEVRVGIGFSYATEASTLKCNGTTVTTQAGNADDGVLVPTDPIGFFLITMGGDDDPLQFQEESYAATHERFTLVPAIAPGATSIEMESWNQTEDDNMFVQVYHLWGSPIVNNPTAIFPSFEVSSPATSNLPFPMFAVTGAGSVASVRLRARLRRFPHVSEENLNLFISRMELELQRGVGLDVVGAGTIPTVRLRISRNGGQTWSQPLYRSAGTYQQYTARTYWTNLGSGRDWVFEILVTDPVFWGLCDCYATILGGTS